MCMIGMGTGYHPPVKPMLRKVLVELKAGYQFPPRLASQISEWIGRCEVERLDAKGARKAEEIGLA